MCSHVSSQTFSYVLIFSSELIRCTILNKIRSHEKIKIKTYSHPHWTTIHCPRRSLSVLQPKTLQKPTPRLYPQFLQIARNTWLPGPGTLERVGEQHFGTHEISLTPTTLYRTPQEIFSTLVHEMCHLWQWDFGNPSRNGYHNKEWAAKMREVGLIPSDTGQLGGKETGQKMTHYIEWEGRCQQAFNRRSKKYVLPFTSLEGEIMKRLIEGSNGTEGGEVEREKRLRKLRPVSRNKTKYTCPTCKVNV